MLLPAPHELDDVALRAAYAHRPGVRLGFIASADGASSLAGSSGALGGPGDHAVMLALRENADAVLVGAGTVRAEGYGDLGLDEAARRRRVAAGLDPEPRLVILGHAIPESALALDPLLLTATSAIGALRAQYPRILCEGGPSLAGSLVDEVDELCLTLSPTLAGGDAGRILAGAPGVPRGLALEHVLEDDGFLFLRYRR